jgi:hypothetical protein
MATFGIVLASIFGGILFVILVAGIAAMIFLHLRTQKEYRALSQQMNTFAKETTRNFESFSSDLAAVLTQQRADVGTMIEGARSSFTGIRQDIKAAQDSQAKAIGIVLKKHEAAIDDLLGKFNGKQIEAAAIRIVGATKEMVRVASLLNQLVMSQDVMPANDLAPEEYGPSDTIYGRQSEAAILDNAVLDEEAAEVAPQFSTGAAE